MMDKPRCYYMHTIDGRPAAFDGKDQIVSVTRYCRWNQRLAKSLRQIRREQQMTFKYRLGLGLKNDCDYSYVLIYPPTQEARDA